MCTCLYLKKKHSIDILVTSRNGDRKTMQSIRITSRIRNNKEVEPVEPVQMNIYIEKT